jgi:hypothetical protein
MCSPDAEELYGDYITEDLNYQAARLAEGPEQLASAINDPDVYEYVRGALVDAVFGMVCYQRISREAAVQFLRSRLIIAIDQQDTHITTKAVEMLGQLHAEEALGEVKAAERANLIELGWIGERYFEEQLARGLAAFEEAKEQYLRYDVKAATDNLKNIPWFNQKKRVLKSLQAVLKEISAPFTEFPADAVRWARKHREEITPHLIRIIQGVPEYAERRATDSEAPGTYGHIIALYLLMEFGVQEILLALLNTLNDSSGDVVECYRDVIDQDMSQILGRLADNPAQLKPLIFNPDADEIVRRDAAEAVVWMVTEGKLDRNAAINLLLDWLKESRGNEYTILTTWITMSLMDLGASHVCQTLVDACDAGEMDELWICTEEIEDALSNGNNTFSKTLDYHRLNRIEHTVVELSQWDWDGSRLEDPDEEDEWGDDDEVDLSEDEGFRKMWLSMRERFTPEQILEFVDSGLTMSPDDSSDEDSDDRSGVIRPIRIDSPKIGRNDPCPCGSGKKYKKCCAKADA